MAETLLVMSKGQAGREADYLAWYESRHLRDVVAVPGVASGRLTRLVDGSSDDRWGVAARYDTSTSVGEVLAGIGAVANTERMPLTDAIDGDSVLMLGATPIRPRQVNPNVTDRSDGLLFIVLTNSTPGDDDAFNAWYSDQHIADVIAVPGFIAAQRFTLATKTAGKASPWRYLAIYEIAPESFEAALAELARRSGTELMPLSETLASDVYAQTFVTVATAP